MVENKKLENTLLTIHSGARRLKGYIATTQKQIPRSQEINDLFAEKVVYAMQSLEKLDKRGAYEAKVAHRRLHYTAKIVEYVEEKSSNNRLTAHVMALALQEQILTPY